MDSETTTFPLPETKEGVFATGQETIRDHGITIDGDCPFIDHHIPMPLSFNVQLNGA